MTTATSVKISDDVLFQELQGDAVLLDLKTGVYFGLDKVGTRIWQLIEQHNVLSDVVASVIGEFDVSEERCTADVLDLVAQLQDQGLVVAAE